eukprot:6544260-Karenia_brevis.AAC.1
MGFTWSLYFAQRINEFQIKKFGELDESGYISDKGRPLVFSRSMGPSHYVYVDNLGVVDVSLASTEQLMHK